MFLNLQFNINPFRLTSLEATNVVHKTVELGILTIVFTRNLHSDTNPYYNTLTINVLAGKIVKFPSTTALKGILNFFFYVWHPPWRPPATWGRARWRWSGARRSAPGSPGTTCPARGTAPRASTPAAPPSRCSPGNWA